MRSGGIYHTFKLKQKITSSTRTPLGRSELKYILQSAILESSVALMGAGPHSVASTCQADKQLSRQLRL